MRTSDVAVVTAIPDSIEGAPLRVEVRRWGRDHPGLHRRARSPTLTADPDPREEPPVMSVFAVIYRYRDDAAALDEHRPRHRDHLRTLHEAGHLLISGPLAEGGGPGALLIFRADAAEQVAGWLDDDPFRTLDLIVEREIRAWNPAFGADRLAPLPVS